MNSLKESFTTQGFAVLKNAVSNVLIDEVIRLYETQLKTSQKYFFRQSTSLWEKSKWNEFGHCKTSFLDVHDLSTPKSFSESVLKILCSENIKNYLKEVLETENLSLVQSMFFDLNTETRAHQDSYYLDSIPERHLLGVWFALEDIPEKAGRFFVIPGSQSWELHLSQNEILSSDLYIQKIEKLIREHQSLPFAPSLSKGDILIWSSDTIHGSLPTQDPSLSRRSLTAHYLPSEYKFGSRYRQKERILDFFNYQGFQIARTPAERKKFSIRHLARSRILKAIETRPKIKSFLMRAGIRNSI